MDIDAVGVYTCSWAALEPLKASGRGVIINISATLHYGATWYQVHASAAKAAIDSVTRTLALEWGAYGIRIAGVAPGPIAGTPGLTKLSGGMDEKAMEEYIGESVPIGRMGTKFEIAMTALFICWNGYITGDTFVVDGGEYLFKPPNMPREMVKEIAKGVEKQSRSMKASETSKL
jgi:peroxisomal 2,4-dienoyl-CoA reductase